MWQLAPLNYAKRQAAGVRCASRAQGAAIVRNAICESKLGWI